MPFGTFLAIAAIALVIVGAYLGRRAGSEDRARLRDIDEAAATAKARDEQAGRDRAQRDHDKLCFQRQLEGILQRHIEPDRSYGHSERGNEYKQFPAIFALLSTLREVETLRSDKVDFEKARSAYRKNIQNLQGQVDDLRKAMGPYIE